MQMAIIGICGKMGNRLYDFYKDSYSIIGIDKINHQFVKTYSNIKEVVEPIDIIIDFSSIDCYEMLIYAIEKNIPVLSGTTGYSDEQIDELYELANRYKTLFVWKANYAKGIKLFSELLKICNKEYNILDFVEIHATSKKDSPSGTAKALAKELHIPEDKIQSLRLNLAPAIHEIIFSSDEERIIIRHEILDKKAFINGFDDELRQCLE